MVKTILAAVLAALMMIATGCGTDSEGVSDSINSEITESDEMEITNKTFPATEQYVKMLGRTAEDEGILWLALSASGVEFTVKGTAASVTVVGDSMVNAGKDKQARFAVYVDGERVLDEQIDAAEKTYDIFTSDTEKEATVTIIKLSEAAESTMGIRSINVTTAEDIKPTVQKDLKIEFIGDSITCGYGVDDEVKENHFSTSTEDATRAYAYKTAQKLNADYSLVSYSGHGIISGYSGDGKKVTSQLVPDVYEKFAKSYGNYNGIFSVSYVDWDFARFQPDVVVINLGTNDASYCGSDRDKITDYSENYAEFLKVVREKNPDAHIVCALGVMGDSLYTGVRKAVELYTEATGDTNISHVRLTPQNGSTGYAADWHPTEATHEIASDEMVAHIKSVLE